MLVGADSHAYSNTNADTNSYSDTRAVGAELEGGSWHPGLGKQRCVECRVVKDDVVAGPPYPHRRFRCGSSEGALPELGQLFVEECSDPAHLLF